MTVSPVYQANPVRRARATKANHAPGRENRTKKATITRSEPGQIFTAGGVRVTWDTESASLELSASRQHRTAQQHH
jgi:hypothetical protein